MQLAFATANTTVTTPGGVHVLIRAGEHWPATDPIVKAHPKLFSRDPKIGLRVSAPLDEGADAEVKVEPAVETATAAPGEKRSTRRTRTQSDSE
ncbi:hypothetical protein [Streptomyces sp.]|uniref:hypothetical protein n=1 Tax=Streptomyces sp. TaxID=1931 RepID=UPI002F9507E3